ncbi:MAG: hypothetical protein WCE68_02800 [Anaerolineales bacterium]
MGCNLAGTVQQSGTPTSPSRLVGNTPSAGITASPSNGNPTATIPPMDTATQAATTTPALTATPAPPSDAVVVNTFDQGVYPFQQAGNCSLGAAIQTVLTQQGVDQCSLPPGSTTVYMPTGTYTLTQSDDAPAFLFGKTQKNREGLLPAGFPLVASQLTILGNGSTIQRTGPVKFGIFQVFVAGNLTLKDLTITGGDLSDTQDGAGGALDILGGAVTLDHVTLTGNQAKTGGAIENSVDVAGISTTLIDTLVTKNISSGEGGGIDNSGVLTLQDSQVADNISKATVFGGGGIYNDSGQVTLDHSQLVGNIANEGGGIYSENGTVKITDQSVISGNVATENHPFIPNGGAGINSTGYIGSDDTPAELIIQDSFVIGNQAPAAVGGGIFSDASLTVTDSVLADNVAGAGGGLYNYTNGLGSLKGSCILQNQAVAVTPKGFGNGVENDNTQSFNARQDWWGSATGPGNSITRNITATPFLNSAPDICVAGLPTPYPTPMNP